MATGLQTIINYSNGIQIDRRKMVGIQYTRNESPRTSVTPTFNPWRFTLDMPDRLRYSDARNLMEELDTLDKVTPQLITFSDNACLSWIFKYNGVMTPTEISAITITSYIGNQLVLGNLPSIDAASVLFEKNDLIQVVGFPYPFTSTTQVTRGSTSTVTVTTHRPNIIANNIVGSGIVVGNSCFFNLFCPNMPTYKLNPGGAVITNGVVTNNALLEFDDSFQLHEWIAA